MWCFGSIVSGGLLEVQVHSKLFYSNSLTQLGVGVFNMVLAWDSREALGTSEAVQSIQPWSSSQT